MSVIGYLRRIQRRDDLDATMKQAIDREIAALEAAHFGRGDILQDHEALEEIARRWQAA